MPRREQQEDVEPTRAARLRPFEGDSNDARLPFAELFERATDKAQCLGDARPLRDVDALAFNGLTLKPHRGQPYRSPSQP